MLEWVSGGTGPRFGLLVHLDDAIREYAYDCRAELDALDCGLDEAPKRGRTVVSMKSDWNRIFPFDEAK